MTELSPNDKPASEQGSFTACSFADVAERGAIELFRRGVFHYDNLADGLEMGPTELFPSNNQVLNEVSFIACNHADGLGGGWGRPIELLPSDSSRVLHHVKPCRRT